MPPARTSSPRRKSIAGSRRSNVHASGSSSTAAGRRSIAFADSSNLPGVDGDQLVKGGRGSLPGPFKADQRAISAMEEAKRIIASQDVEAGPSTSSTSTPYNVHALLRDFASRKSTHRHPRRSLATVEDPNGQGGAWDPLQLDWDLFKDWPEGLELEEKEMKQYYKYLKFIHLEHETKIRFITEIVDDLEADPPREAIVYTPRDVKEKEAEMLLAKTQLKEAKQTVRTLRHDVDTLAQRVSQPYLQLSASCAEAKSLLDECMDLELELVQMKEQNGAAGITDVDVEDMDLETLPPVGTLTSGEAERFCERQEDELVALEESNEKVDALMSRLRSDAKAAIKDVDRLSSEKHTAERAAREARELGVGGRKRDRHVEAACSSHSATLALLRGLLGLRRIEAPDEKRLNLVYVSSADGCELSLCLQFDRPGGRLRSVELHHPTQPVTLLPPPGAASSNKNGRKSLGAAAAATVSPEFATLLKAIKANDVAAVVMEGWDWVERKGAEFAK